MKYIAFDLEIALPSVSWISGSGRPWDVHIGELMTVKEVMETDPGAVPHWMTNPPSLGDMVGWLE
jgi:hypothetical protein